MTGTALNLKRLKERERVLSKKLQGVRDEAVKASILLRLAEARYGLSVAHALLAGQSLAKAATCLRRSGESQESSSVLKVSQASVQIARAWLRVSSRLRGLKSRQGRGDAASKA